MKKTVDGLVLRERPYGESDKLLTVLCADEGQMTLMAKGARSVKSKMLPICRAFCYSNFEYYERGDMRWVSGGSVNDSFSFGDDLVGFSLASYVAQVALDITGEAAEAHDILRMTLNTLYAIEKKLRPYDQIKAVYEWFAVNISGLEPDLSVCSACMKTTEGDMWLDVMNGLIVCDKCQKEHSGGAPVPETDRFETRNILVPIDASALAAMRYVQNAPLERIFSFSLKSEESLRSFCRATETYMTNHLERSFETLDFYRSVKD